jgi:hypothetical protein
MYGVKYGLKEKSKLEERKIKIGRVKEKLMR